ncbi:MAG: sigma-70 family RNA polymerase sigma factor [Ruminococcus sp.]|nr:sigma-70 family RNA polymerase sigma factor [Ruminococcus sp.]
MDVGATASLRELCNEDLISLCREDDRSALSELIVRFAPSVRKRAESFAGTAHDDLMQEGFLALLDAVRNYSPDRGASFATFASACIRNRMINVSKRIGLDHDELPDELDIPDDPSEIPENILMENEGLKELYHKIEGTLSSLEMKVMRYYVAGHSYRCIAEQLGIEEKSVDNAVQRMRHKLRAVLR